MNDQQVVQSIGDMAGSLTELGDVIQTSLPVLIAAPFVIYFLLIVALKWANR